MPFHPIETETSYYTGDWASYRLTFHSSWDPGDGLDPVWVAGDLDLFVNAALSNEVLVESQADPRVQALVNVLAEALDGTGWSVNARKRVRAHQTIEPDGPATD
jgi:hypothetical protein